MAPLHNPVALRLIDATRTILPTTPSVVVSTPAPPRFHSALPAETCHYAVPIDGSTVGAYVATASMA